MEAARRGAGGHHGRPREGRRIERGVATPRHEDDEDVDDDLDNEDIEDDEDDEDDDDEEERSPARKRALSERSPPRSPICERDLFSGSSRLMARRAVGAVNIMLTLYSSTTLQNADASGVPTGLPSYKTVAAPASNGA